MGARVGDADASQVVAPAGSVDLGLVVNHWNEQRTIAKVIFGWIARNWIVVLAGALAGVLLASSRAAQPPTYVSEALVTLAPQRTQVQFDPNVKTDQGVATIDAERRQALVELVVNDRVERDAARRLASSQTGFNFHPGELVRQVDGSLRPRSEVISIVARSDTPAEATAIASAWAQGYIEFVNQLYGSLPGPSLASLEAARDQAAAQSDAAQAAYEGDLRSSQVEAITDQIHQREQELARLSPPTAGNTQISAADDYRVIQLKTVNDLSELLRRIDTSRTALQLLVDGSSSDMISGSSETALALIKAQLVSIQNSLPRNVQLSVPSSDAATTRSALQSLLASLNAARTQISGELEAQRRAYESQVAARADVLNDELRVLRSQLAEASSRRTNLAAQRDLALNTYTVLAKKVEEQRVADAAVGREVELASDASPAQRIPQSRVGPTALGLVLGAALASVLALTIRAATRFGRRRIPSFGSAGGLS